MSNPDAAPSWDVIIVGAGPAGLSAALLLGRCRRRVAIFDDGHPRNARSTAAHGVFTRDGASPKALREMALEQLEPYGVAVFEDTVTEVFRDGKRFSVVAKRAGQHVARALLLATGLTDVLPNIPGVEARYGRSIFHCPFCDGWEVRDKRLVAYCRGAGAVDFATGLTNWSQDVVLCTDGPAHFSEHERHLLEAFSIPVRVDPIAQLEGPGGHLERVIFESGPPLEADALFFKTGTRQRSDLAQSLGCDVDEAGMVCCDAAQRTGVEGLHVAGDSSQDLNLITIAAAEGTRAAVAIHNELNRADRAARFCGAR